jgi:2-polyprenyl-3-methyl-5-hydroxy-6-metoxy-1,4-benzoquinol methylase
MNNYDQYFDANKELWNKRTAIHKESAFYDIGSFKAGKSSLNETELRELGDVNGKSMLHLQCHFGMDTLSWSRLGAKCTGVDLSDEAINIARGLNDDLKLNAEFICSNVYDLKDHLQDQFDIVFTSYGVIGWLPDLDKWAELIAYYLKPGGIFFMAEFHPFIWTFDDDFKELKYYYHNEEVIEINSQGTYTDREADIRAKEFSWNHSISEVLNALIKHGLKIESFNEFNYSPYNCFKNMVEENGRFYIRGMEKKIPMVYSLKAMKEI